MKQLRRKVTYLVSWMLLLLCLLGRADARQRVGLTANPSGLTHPSLTLPEFDMNSAIEPPPAGEKLESPVRFAYQGTWEYRWGESPATAQEALVWAQPSDNSPGWLPTSQVHALPGRHGQNFLWMRTRLCGPSLDDPTLYLFIVDQIVEAYLDGQLIYRFGAFDGPHKLRFAGYKTHLIRLGVQYQGKLLALRIYSQHTNIGISGTVRLGERGDLITELFSEDLSRLLVGALLAVLGLLVLVFYALQRQERAYLMYGSFALTVGVYFLTQLQVRALLIPHPLLWVYVELGSLYVMSFCLCGYIDQVFGRGPLGLTRRLWQLHGLHMVLCVGALLSGRVTLLQTLPVFQGLLMVDALVLPWTVVRAAWQGSTEVRVFLAGFAVAAAVLVYDVLAAIGIVPRTQLTMSHLGNAAFVLSMGAILLRRFVLLQQRLRDYAAVLQLSLASTQALAPERRAQVALDELLRMLGAERALLFLFEESTKSLAFSVGRDRHGNQVENPQGISYTVVRRAVARRRPVMLQAGQRPTSLQSAAQEPSAVTPGAPDAPIGHSVMAAPLLARDQLLGVVYLTSQTSKQGFRNDDLSILVGLASHLATAIVSSRALQLEVEAAMTKQRLREQQTVLDAAAHMAAGDLSTAIEVPPGSAMADLAQALESMRRDIFAKVKMLQTRTREIQSLNEELRRQIEQRSRRLMAALLSQQCSQQAPLKPLAVGQLLVGRYRVQATLGQGAMGIVYQVERITDQRQLAAKLLLRRADPTAVARFAREAQILARLDHPNLIAILDVDMTAGGVLFIVLELVIGSALSALSARYRELPWAVGVLRQIADGLAAIHEAGVVHRDLKPANVLVASDTESAVPLVKLADFGVSLLLGDQADPRPRPSQTSAATGGPSAADAQSDAEPAAAADPWNQSDAFDEPQLVVAARAKTGGHAAPPATEEEDDQLATASLVFGVPPLALAVPSSSDGTGEVPDPEPGRPPKAASPALTARLTQAGMLVGTPMYMAPELWNDSSQDIGPASDIFSFGVIAFELLTGQAPFAEAPVLSLWQQEPVVIAQARAVRPELPVELASLVDSCLRQDPAQRPSARTLATLLQERAASGGG